jgi:hypothetical protein
VSRNRLSTIPGRILIVFLPAILLTFSTNCIAQSAPISPSDPSFIANLKDPQRKDVVEDFTSPTLDKTHLIPDRPLIGFVDDKSGYTVSEIRLRWRQNDPIDLWLMKPANVKNPPVIVHLYGYPSDTDIFKDPDWQELVTRGGFAAAGFVTPLTGHRYHDIEWSKWFLSELQQCLAESSHDVQMVLNYLASRGDLDMNRVGVVGQLSGATVGILASAADPRIKVLDAIDPWGDWPTWMEKSEFVPKAERPNYVKPEFLAKVATLETLDWMPKVQAKKFRLQQRITEHETPWPSKQKLKTAIPAGATYTYYKTAGEFEEAVGKDGDKSLDWIKTQLQSLQPDAPESAVAVKK